jgi:glycosyltransferase involved in cell wall biosynthesis
MTFSIGIPAYKAKYLKECIDSILCQEYSDFELIIVNDASPENIDNIVFSYQDKRIQYYKNEKNFGAENVVDNWNKCLSYAQGIFFILMGDDDMLAPNYLNEFVKLITKNSNLDIYHCRTLIIDENSKPISLTPAYPEYESVYDNIWHRINGNRLQFISDFVYRTETLKKNSGFYKLELAWASDDISSFIAMNNKGIAHCNIPLLYYRRSSITISSTGKLELKLKAINREREWYDSFLKENVPLTDNDMLLKKNIAEQLNKYFKKKTLMTIGNSFNYKIRLTNYYYFYKIKKKYGLSLTELFYLFFLFEKGKYLTHIATKFIGSHKKS